MPGMEEPPTCLCLETLSDYVTSSDFTPVCTTELGKMAAHASEFAKRGVKLLGLSCDDVSSHVEWVLGDVIESLAGAILVDSGYNKEGFIRNEFFDPKLWIVPGGKMGSDFLSEETLSEGRKIYIRGKRKVKSKTVADVVEALIGAYLSTGGEVTALLFMDWIVIKVDLMNTPYERHFQLQEEKFVDVRYLESLLNYSFNDPSLLVEALTHGSYMLPEIPRCYQVAIVSVILFVNAGLWCDLHFNMINCCSATGISWRLSAGLSHHYAYVQGISWDVTRTVN
ncbi:hypothetical protein OIU78_017729 [Salix suchowensis]|nr:hypothetical protein OIU78_017729 [Salix suchowensis]